MIYLSGCWSAWVESQSRGYPLGVLVTPDTGVPTTIRGRPWAADNACFNRGEKFDRWRWLTWLTGLSNQGCLFAACPDVVGDWKATWDRACPEFDVVRMLGFRAAVVAQDGMESATVAWDRFDALFIGGSTAWKESAHAARLCKTAREQGKWVHMGRVNSMRRLRIAEEFGCDSVDGTFLAFGPKTNLPRLLNWLRHCRFGGLHGSRRMVARGACRAVPTARASGTPAAAT